MRMENRARMRTIHMDAPVDEKSRRLRRLITHDQVPVGVDFH